VLVVQINASAASYFYLRFNSDSGANYSNVNMAGDGGTTNSGSGTHNHVLLNYFQSASTTETNNILTNVMDYSATDKHKSVLSRNNTATRVVEALASRWANTSAITSFAITPSTGNFATGSTFALYGIAS
jgi:hypothetical protein